MRRTLNSVIAQTVLPALWVIVDDGSTDETPQILAEYAAEHDWIRVVQKPDRGHRAVGPGVIEAFYAGYDTIDSAKYTYLCKLDLDLDLPVGYFEGLIAKMEDDPRLGTCSGKTWYRGSNGEKISERIGDEMSIGDYRMKLTDLHDVEGANWKAEEGVFQVYEEDTLITELRPQKRIYNATQTPTTESAIYSINMGHIFLTMPEVSPEGVAVARGVLNPLILWVWGGGIIMGLGVILNILRPRKKEE